MKRRNKVASVAHGAAFAAPSEFGFVTSDSPPPPKVEERKAAGGVGAAPKGPGAVIWAALNEFL